ncbi:alpha/beta fold hydrolase [Sutcliffiella horikoshii]|uniref:alpha/beta fold hydrolase n=1 Tax=Sutcliffiella horikoshii TaxID=79883 RepID=UPI001CFECB0E|nr:alpha/beta hydrolase [Sutcliffiella horikoshii]
MMRHILTRDNVRIFYRLIGKGPITILFIHPPGMGHITFKQQLPLSEDFQLLYVDLRGNGKSHKGNVPIRFSLLARDLYDACHELGIDKVFICGYSNGASIAMEISMRYPELVDGLFLIGAFSEVDSFLLGSEFLLGILASKMNLKHLLANVIANAHAYSKDFGKEMANYYLHTDADTLHQMYVEGLSYNCTNSLASIKCPIVLIYGQRDYYVHHYQYKFMTSHHNTKVVYISGARHQIPTKHPTVLNMIMKKFIQNQMIVEKTKGSPSTP